MDLETEPKDTWLQSQDRSFVAHCVMHFRGLLHANTTDLTAHTILKQNHKFGSSFFILENLDRFLICQDTGHKPTKEFSQTRILTKGTPAKRETNLSKSFEDIWGTA